MASMGIGHPWPSQVPRSSASLRDSARVRLLQSSSMLYRCQLSKRKLLKPKSSKLTMTRKFPTKSSHRCREKTGRGGFSTQLAKAAVVTLVSHGIVNQHCEAVSTFKSSSRVPLWWDCLRYLMIPDTSGYLWNISGKKKQDSLRIDI